MSNAKDQENTLGSKFFYEIAEAAKILEITEISLLQFMASGVINGSIFLAILDPIISVRRSQYSSSDRLHIVCDESAICDHHTFNAQKDEAKKKAYRGFQYLCKTGAKSILLSGVYKQRKFIEIFHQSEAQDEIIGRNRRNFSHDLKRSISDPRYRCCSADRPITGSMRQHRSINLPHSIQIRKESIYVDLGELIYLIRNYHLHIYANSTASRKYRQLLNEIKTLEKISGTESLFNFKRKAFHSQKLVDLIQVSIHFWGIIYLEFERFPDFGKKNNEIQSYLVQNYGFSKGLASIASKNIIPTYAKQQPEILTQLKYFGLPNPRLKALLEASEHFYSNLNLSERNNFPRAEEVEQWFKKVWNFPSYNAKAAFQIIEPNIEDIEDFITEHEEALPLHSI